MRPFMTDPAALASLEGQQYVVLRPTAEVGAFYAAEQRTLLDRLPSALPHPNTGHVTLRGFAEPDRLAEATRLSRRAKCRVILSSGHGLGRTETIGSRPPGNAVPQDFRK